MAQQVDKKLAEKALIVAVSSRALFDMEESNRVFEEDGPEAYMRHQIELERESLRPGVAFPLVRKLLAMNHLGSALGREILPSSTTSAASAPVLPTEPEEASLLPGVAAKAPASGRELALPRVEVILLSRNNADAGLRVFNAIADHRLEIRRAVFTTGRGPYAYARAFGAHLFLSANEDDVRGALKAGIAAATILTTAKVHEGLSSGEGFEEGTAKEESSEIRIAFDGDAVLFDDQAERVYKAEGLPAFRAHESEHAEDPLPEGPFAGFLDAIHRIQQAFPPETTPLRTALITARGAPSHERVIRTLRRWGIRLDEMVFLDGLDKRPFLEAFGADIFFDDQRVHVESAGQAVGAAHVPHGIANE